MIPFLRFGEVVTGGPHFPLTSDALMKVLKGQASIEVFQSIFHAVGDWFDSLKLYMYSLPCFFNCAIVVTTTIHI